VGHDHDRLPGAVEAPQQPQHVGGGGAVEVAGGLVGQQQRRLVHERPGDGDTLALAAGEQGRQRLGLVGHAQLLQQRHGPAAGGGPAPRSPAEETLQLDVVQDGEVLDQVEGLEHEPDLPSPQPGPPGP
jgi:hypothetical protein